MTYTPESVERLVEVACGLHNMEQAADSYDALNNKELWAELYRALSSLEDEKCCEWTWDDSDMMFHTSCGNKFGFDDGEGGLRDFHYCPFNNCGRTIKEVTK